MRMIMYSSRQVAECVDSYELAGLLLFIKKDLRPGIDYVEDRDGAISAFSDKGVFRLSRYFPVDIQDKLCEMLMSDRLAVNALQDEIADIKKMIAGSNQVVSEKSESTTEPKVENVVKHFGGRQLEDRDKYNFGADGRIYMKDGSSFATAAELCKHYGIHTNTLRRCIKETKMNVDEAVQSILDNKRSAHHSSSESFKPKKTTDNIEARWGWSEKINGYIAPDKKVYASKDAMCKAFNVLQASARYWVNKGYTFSETLEKMKNSDKPTVSIPKPIVKVVHKSVAKEKTKQDLNKVMQVYTQDDQCCPGLSDEQREWAIRVYDVMHSGKLKGQSMNSIRRAVYEKMRNVYGIVLSQATKDYISNYGLEAPIKCSYYRVVTQTPQLASLFESIVTDMAETGM